MEKKILLDTNFLVAPFQLSIPLFEELDRLYPYADLYTLEDAVQEARSIESGKYRDLVDQLLDSRDVEILETEGSGTVDSLILELSDEFVVATNDRELKRELLDRGAEVVIVRSGDHLEARNRQEFR